MDKTKVNLNEIRVFENFNIEQLEFGHVILSTEVTTFSLNYYDITHGGYLFTLCDQMGGLIARSTGVESVTSQATINYLKPGFLGDKLFVEGILLHNGRSTQVIEATVKNEKGTLLTKATLTMFNTKKSENKS
ncbi:PaaI family thioesterase [Streptococcus uberis]